ncbi:MAG TPA: metallophosphoesterase [Candidatus Thermoplasmatota archaeon]|nr:metallophosphoesterase [Candidatus Thermoplasmatota archaeon]
MTRVAHISDLHFGRDDPSVVEGLLTDLRRQRPALVAVSGDLTQRARGREFAAAAAFLADLPCPWLAVPGNHDIPLHNLGRRLWSPFGRYRRFISKDLEPRHLGEGIAVLGLNTAWHWVWKGGRIRPRQLASLRAWSEETHGRLRAIVAHHPFSRPEAGGHSLVRGWEAAMLAMEEARVELVLTGHHHLAGHSESRAFAIEGPRRVVVVRAGTATSVRGRGEANSYNLVEATQDAIRVERRDWDGGQFVPAATQEYPRRKEPQMEPQP